MSSEDPDRPRHPPDRPDDIVNSHVTDSGPVQLGPGSDVLIDLAPSSHHHQQHRSTTAAHHHHHHHHIHRRIPPDNEPNRPTERELAVNNIARREDQAGQPSRPPTASIPYHRLGFDPRGRSIVSSSSALSLGTDLLDPLSQRLFPRQPRPTRSGMSDGPPHPAARNLTPVQQRRADFLLADGTDPTPAQLAVINFDLDDVPVSTPTRLRAELAAIHLGGGSGSSTPDPLAGETDRSRADVEGTDVPVSTAIALARSALQAGSGSGSGTRSRPDDQAIGSAEFPNLSGLNFGTTHGTTPAQEETFQEMVDEVRRAGEEAGRASLSSQGPGPSMRLISGRLPFSPRIPSSPRTTTTTTTRTTINRISADGETQATEHPLVFTEGDQADEAVQRMEAAHREAYDLLLNRIRDRSAAEAVERSSELGGDVDVEDMDEDEDGMEDEDDDDEEEDDEEDHEDDGNETAHEHEHEERQDPLTTMPVMPEGLIEVWGPPAPGSDEQTRFTLFRPTIVGGNPQMRIVQPTIISVDGQDGVDLHRDPNTNAVAGPSTHLEQGRGLGRTKSVKRRRLDPSAKNATTWLPSFMTHPISRIPTSDLPEYMRFSNLPIRAIPTSLNGADCAARLLLTPGLATPPPNTSPQEPLLAVCYVGTGERGDPDASAVRANHPIPSTCGVYYYEVEIASKGRDGYISIGFCSRWTDLNRLVGWERESWAWHMDDGFIFESRGEGINRRWPTSTTGDIIGCGIDFTTGKAFFTKNSRYIGEAFGSLQDKGRLYPAVGLRTPGEKLLVNFTGPFKYDIVSHVQGTRDRVQAEVQSSPMYMYLPRPVEPAKTSVEDGDVEMQAPGTTGGTSTPTTIQDRKSTMLKSTTDLDHSTLADKVHTCDNCTEPPSTRRRAIRDVDTSLTSSVLEYLKGAGHFEAAKGMERVLQRRAADEADMDAASGVDQSMDENEETPVEVLEEEKIFDHLRRCRDQYIRGDAFEVVSALLTETSAEAPQSITGDFLTEYKHGIWGFRLRLQYFYRLLRGDPLSPTELNPDSPAFKFFYGPDHVKGFSPDDRLGRLLAAGQYLQSEHSGSTEEEVVKGLDVFALMAYEDVKQAPEELTRKMGEGVRRAEAGMLFVDLRVYHGQPATSRIEQAYRQTSHTLLELGVLHGSAQAAFLEMPK